MPYSDRHITLVRVGRIVTACAYITLTSDFTQVSNVSVNETIPEGFRPSGDSRAVMRGTDNSGATSFYLYGTPGGGKNGVARHRIYRPIRRYIRLLDYRVAFPNPDRSADAD